MKWDNWIDLNPEQEDWAAVRDTAVATHPNGAGFTVFVLTRQNGAPEGQFAEPGIYRRHFDLTPSGLKGKIKIPWALEWSKLIGGAFHSISAVSWGPGRIDVVASTTVPGQRRNALRHLWFDRTWHGLDQVEDLAPAHDTYGPVAITSRGEGRLDLYSVIEAAPHARIERSAYTPINGWTRWVEVPELFRGQKLGTTRIEVASTGAFRSDWIAWRDPYPSQFELWHDWYEDFFGNSGGERISDVSLGGAAVANTPDRVFILDGHNPKNARIRISESGVWRTELLPYLGDERTLHLDQVAISARDANTIDVLAKPDNWRQVFHAVGHL